MQDVPKIVRARLQRPSPATAEPHPDADLLTAFAEQSLAAQERDHVLQHLALCGECRDVIVLALPATEAAVLTGPVGASVRTARIGWFSWPALRWAVVAAGILVVASVGIRQYSQHHQGTSLVSFSVMPQDQTAPTSPQDQPYPRAMASETVAPQAETKKPTAIGKQTEQIRTAPKKFAATANYNPTPAGAASVEVSPDAPQVTEQTTAQNQVQDHLIQNQQAESSQSSADFVYKAKSPPAQAFPRSMALALPRWTISANGTLQRSLDEGKTWLDVDVVVRDSATSVRSEATDAAKFAQAKTASSSHTIFRAVSVSDDAAEIWAGGSNGALYHTVDGGTRWLRVVPSDSGIALTGDIVSIQFSDPRNGIVTTSSTEVWTTADAGQTWHKQP